MKQEVKDDLKEAFRKQQTEMKEAFKSAGQTGRINPAPGAFPNEGC